MLSDFLLNEYYIIRKTEEKFKGQIILLFVLCIVYIFTNDLNTPCAIAWQKPCMWLYSTYHLKNELQYHAKLYRELLLQSSSGLIWLLHVNRVAQALEFVMSGSKQLFFNTTQGYNNYFLELLDLSDYNSYTVTLYIWR